MNIFAQNPLNTKSVYMLFIIRPYKPGNAPCFNAVMAGCLNFMLIRNYICWVISSWYVHIDSLLKSEMKSNKYSKQKQYTIIPWYIWSIWITTESRFQIQSIVRNLPVLLSYLLKQSQWQSRPLFLKCFLPN